MRSLLITSPSSAGASFRRAAQAIFILCLYIPSVHLSCYQMKIITFRTTETPEYQFVMHLHANQTLSSVTRVNEEVAVPLWNIILVQYIKDGRRSISARNLYNTTLKVCDFWRNMRRIRIFGNIGEVLFKSESSGNMSLACPLKVGTYVMNNIHLPETTGALKMIYRPNTIYGLFGNVYSQLPDKKKILRCSYEINGTVVKKC